MKKLILIILTICSTQFTFTQNDESENILDNVISSTDVVDALVNRVPGAKRIYDSRGYKNIKLRGRQSLQTASDQVLWEVDGLLYYNPPNLDISQVKYVEVLKGLAATNKYGSEGAGGVIIIKTQVNADKISSRKNLWNQDNNQNKPVGKKDEKIKKKKKKKKKKNEKANKS